MNTCSMSASACQGLAASWFQCQHLSSLAHPKNGGMITSIKLKTSQPLNGMRCSSSGQTISNMPFFCTECRFRCILLASCACRSAARFVDTPHSSQRPGPGLPVVASLPSIHGCHGWVRVESPNLRTGESLINLLDDTPQNVECLE